MAKSKGILIKRITFDITENDREFVKEWVLNQSDLVIAIKYLIEKEVHEHGSIIDASTYIPMKITDSTFRINVQPVDKVTVPSIKKEIVTKKQSTEPELSDANFELYRLMS